MQHADEKRGWIQHKKIIVVIAILLIIGGIYGFRLWTETRFLLGKSIIISVIPAEASFSLAYGEQQNITFTVTAEHAWPCAASCQFQFQDTSSNATIDAGKVLLSNKQSFQRSYPLSVSRLGSGQDLYNFQVRCKPKESIICPATTDETFRSSLVIANYDLNELQKQLKEVLRENITLFLRELSQADVLLQEASNAVFIASKAVNMEPIRQEKEQLNSRFAALHIAAENFRAVWAQQDYLSLSRQFNQSFQDAAQDLQQRAIQLNQSADALLNQHNRVVRQLQEFAGQYQLLELSNATSTGEDRQQAENLSRAFISIITAIRNQTTNYPQLEQESSALLQDFAPTAAMVRNRTMQEARKGEYFLTEEQGLRCLLENCSSLPQINEMPILNAICTEITAFTKEYQQLQNRSRAQNASFPDDPAFAQYAADLAQHYREQLRQEYRKSGYSSLIPPEQPGDVERNPAFDAYNMSAYYFARQQYAPPLAEYQSSVCIPPTPPLPSIPPAPQIQGFPAYTAISTIETALSDAPPVCCVFGACEPCCHDESCRNNPDTFPVVLLHGHSVLASSSPEYSLDAFNKIQYRLQQDGYINAGILSLASIQEGLRSGEWGVSGKPVTVKVSYYYDAFQKAGEYVVVPTKSETIDTYAVRLRDLVDAVLQKTGKPRVKMIANSMGGLVARRYLQIFGDDAVQLLIMTGTPNKGIIGRVNDFCPLLGEGLECRDMQEGSLFLNKLNDPAKQPNIPLYIIAGSGCDMGGRDGDGIVLLDHALIPNARQFIINGTCAGTYGEPLHTAMLDIERYPDVYGIIKDILAE
ncbi:hypothetical protein HY491_04920 [Candidatus Woesearchaeota archaeon]|nr:hypothetical protein [Candidatus Woesearchaeota archaeon]